MPTALKELLPTLIKHDDSWQLTLLRTWNTVVGNLNTKVRLEKIVDDTLILGVFDACWMQELYLLTPLLITTINQSLDKPYIKHLRFKRAIVHKPQPLRSNTQRTVTKVHKALTAREQSALSHIKDPQLSTALHNFLVRCHTENQ